MPSYIEAYRESVKDNEGMQRIWVNVKEHLILSFFYPGIYEAPSNGIPWNQNLFAKACEVNSGIPDYKAKNMLLSTLM